MKLCVKCKGRNFCGHKCAIYEKLKVQKKVIQNLKQDFFGKTPNVFVGKFGYPDVNVGLLSTEKENYNEHDNPLLWSKNSYGIDQIINLRSELVNSGFNSNITAVRLQNSEASSVNKRFLEMSKEISLSQKPVDTEIHLKDRPTFRLSFNQEAAPHGPNVKLDKAEITENVHVPTKVDKIVSDYDYKATSALNSLSKRFDEHYLTKLLSVGNLGIKNQRKLVPTRWAITAVDDTLGKKGINEIKQYSNTVNYEAFFGGHMGNYYFALFFPEVWGYELFETSLPRSVYNQSSDIESMTDYEGYEGRKQYAFDTAGGYYAARLGTIEFLRQRKRQGAVLLLRFITDEYWAPLGVWVVREAVRKALLQKGLEFSSKELMLSYAKKLAIKKFNFNIDGLLGKSKLLKNLEGQKKLNKYFN